MKKHTDTPSTRPADPRHIASKQSSSKPIRRRKKYFHFYLIFIFIWLIAATVAGLYGYRRFNEFLIHYESVYQASRPGLVMEQLFTHFEQRDIDFIWQNMNEHPAPSGFESEDTIRAYMTQMLEGKTITYREASVFSEETPNYVIEADGYTIAEVSLSKNPAAVREYGFPSWVMSSLTYYTEPIESVTVTAPVGSAVYVNGIELDDSYMISENDENDDNQYVEPYSVIPGIRTYEVTDLYMEPEVEVLDFYGTSIPLDYNEGLKSYTAGYSTNHPEREELEQLGIEFTTLFANVISMDADINELNPYFPPNSLALSYISRSTALEYFTGHGAVTMQNEEVREFIAYTEDLVYMEVHVEQAMQMYGGIEELPTDTHLFWVRIDGQWQIAGIKY